MQKEMAGRDRRAGACQCSSVVAWFRTRTHASRRPLCTDLAPYPSCSELALLLVVGEAVLSPKPSSTSTRLPPAGRGKRLER
jgi:hypothetical protein